MVASFHGCSHTVSNGMFFSRSAIATLRPNGLGGALISRIGGFLSLVSRGSRPGVAEQSYEASIWLVSFVRNGRLDFKLAAQLDDAVGRQAEEFHRAFGVAHHPGEQLLAPDRHAVDVGGKRGLGGEEEARLHHLEREAAAVDHRQRLGHVHVLEEAEMEDYLVEA